MVAVETTRRMCSFKTRNLIRPVSPLEVVYVYLDSVNVTDSERLFFLKHWLLCLNVAVTADDFLQLWSSHVRLYGLKVCFWNTGAAILWLNHSINHEV